MEERAQAALNFIEANPDAKIAKVARDFGVSRNILRGRLDGRTPYSERPATNTRLTEAEEKALCKYIDRLDRINLRCRANFVTEAANQLLQARGKPHSLPPQVGKH
jgi:transposase-like protein